MTPIEFLKKVFWYNSPAKPLAHLHEYSDPEITRDMCLQYVSNQHFSELQGVPERFRDDEIIDKALAANGGNIRFVPEEKLTEERCLAAIDRDPDSLKFIREDMKTDKVVSAAVSRSSYAVAFLPERLQTPEMYRDVVKYNPKAYPNIPEEKRTPDLDMLAVSLDGRNLTYISSENRNPDLCMAAVRQSGFALCLIPMEERTQELCEAAFEQTPQSYNHFPLEFRTPEKAAYAYQYVQENFYKDDIKFIPYDSGVLEGDVVMTKYFGERIGKDADTYLLMLKSTNALNHDPLVLCDTPDDAHVISKALQKPVFVKPIGKDLKGAFEDIQWRHPNRNIHVFTGAEIDLKTVKEFGRNAVGHTPPFNMTEKKKGLSSYKDFLNARNPKSLVTGLTSQLGKENALRCPGLNQTTQQSLER